MGNKNPDFYLKGMGVAVLLSILYMVSLRIILHTGFESVIYFSLVLLFYTGPMMLSYLFSSNIIHLPYAFGLYEIIIVVIPSLFSFLFYFSLISLIIRLTNPSSEEYHKTERSPVANS